jgi:hypothetical protein
VSLTTSCPCGSPCNLEHHLLRSDQMDRLTGKGYGKPACEAAAYHSTAQQRSTGISVMLLLPQLCRFPANGIWDIAGAVGNLVSCHHPCGTVNPRRAPTPGFGCHTGCPVITQAYTCTTCRALSASRQSSIVPVHKGGAPLPRARGPGCELGTSRL